jgi:hypothetical protein
LEAERLLKLVYVTECHGTGGPWIHHDWAAETVLQPLLSWEVEKLEIYVFYLRFSGGRVIFIIIRQLSRIVTRKEGKEK